MTSTKYIGMDVHKQSISIAVMNSAGKIVMESAIETKASMILQFIDGLRGDLHVTFEEGTSAAWLYDLLKPHVTKLVVCDPRKNASMREGNQNDKIDARRLAELLRLNHLSPVYHGEHAHEVWRRKLAQLSRRHQEEDVGRVMSRVKAVLSQLGHSLHRQQVYAPHHRVEWLGKITGAGSAPAGGFYLPTTRCAADGASAVRRDRLRRPEHKASKLLCQIPSIGPIRSRRTASIFADPEPFPHQAAAMDLQRISYRNTKQCRRP